MPIYNESAEVVADSVRRLLKLSNIKQIIVSISDNDPHLLNIKHLFQLYFSNQHSVMLHCCDGLGRAYQMNSAAKLASQSILLFLHADTGLPEKAGEAIINATDDTNQWGRFNLKFDDDSLAYLIIAWFINTRSRLTGICTGDQAIFITNSLFKRLEGFKQQRLMEDIDLSYRAKRMTKPNCLKIKVTTSPRRWQTNGVMRTIWLMWKLRFLYWLGVPADKLAHYYNNPR